MDAGNFSSTVLLTLYLTLFVLNSLSGNSNFCGISESVLMIAFSLEILVIFFPFDKSLNIFLKSGHIG